MFWRIRPWSSAQELLHSSSRNSASNSGRCGRWGRCGARSRREPRGQPATEASSPSIDGWLEFVALFVVFKGFCLRLQGCKDHFAGEESGQQHEAGRRKEVSEGTGGARGAGRRVPCAVFFVLRAVVAWPAAPRAARFGRAGTVSEGQSGLYTDAAWCGLCVCVCVCGPTLWTLPALYSAARVAREPLDACSLQQQDPSLSTASTPLLFFHSPGPTTKTKTDLAPDSNHRISSYSSLLFYLFPFPSPKWIPWRP